MGERYGHRIGQFMRDYGDWYITAGRDGTGYRARKRGACGRSAGPRITARTLDELAAKLGPPGPGPAGQRPE